MYAKYTSVDDGAYREGVEALDAMSPSRRVAVFPIALVVETVNLSDLSALFYHFFTFVQRERESGEGRQGDVRVGAGR